MICFSIYLLISTFLSFTILLILHPSHWIIRYTHRTFYLTYLSIYLFLYPSKNMTQPIPHQIHHPSHSGFTAAQRVLSMPELVSEILSWDAAGYKEHHWVYGHIFSRRRFARYARVNKIWFHEAMRYLWWTPQPYSKLKVLEEIPRERKQVYADFMVDAYFENYPQLSATENRILNGLSFPRLRFARMRVWTGQQLLSLPEIVGCALQDLTIDIVPVNNGRGGALSDNRMQERLAKRLIVGTTHVGVW